MPTIEISINGQVVAIPGVYVSTSPIPVVPNVLLPSAPLIFLAAGQGGIPFTPYNFTDPNSLISAMRGAISSDFVPFFFNPSTQLNGASLITYINVAPNTQSTASILASGSTAVINMISANYGTPSNLLQYSISTGSTAGKYMALIDGFNGNTIQADNLGLPFQLEYTGDANGVTYTVGSSVTGEATLFTTSSSNVGESVSIDLTSATYSTINAVVAYLNGTGYYNARIVSNGLLPSFYLDVVSSVALPSGSTFVDVTATLGDIVNFINTSNPVLASAVISPAITSSPSYTPINTSLAYFAGATTGVPSNTNYASGFNVALTQPAWVVFADSNTASIRSLGAQHAQTASSVNQGRWRRFVTGSALNELATTAETNAISLNEYEVTYVWPGVQQTNTTTNMNQIYDGLHTAAAVAGMMCGNPVTTPLTAKTLVGNGVEQLTDLATKITLQDSGVLVLDYPSTTRIPTLLSDVTTWQNDNTPANVFNQQVSERFALSYYITRQLQPYVGTVASNFTITAMYNQVKNLLNGLIYNGSSAIGLLNSWDPTTLVITYDGSTQAATVQVSVVLVGEIIYIPVYISIAPLNITINSAGLTNS